MPQKGVTKQSFILKPLPWSRGWLTITELTSVLCLRLKQKEVELI